MRIMCVGGRFDGKMAGVPDREWKVVFEHGKEVYIKDVIEVGGERFYLMVHEDMSINEALKMILESYEFK